MKKLFIVFVALGFFIAAPAYAILYGFDNITNNNPADAAIGEAQLSVDVTDQGSGLVLFTFSNTGPEASSITDVYFNDASLFDFASLIDADDNPNGYLSDPGVDFSPYASPGDLPGGNNASPPFVMAPASPSFDSDPDVQANGVNPGEFLGILFEDASFTDVIAAINSLDLRIGIHVQGFASGGSESFVNGNGISSVPEPAAMLLLGGGLICLAVVGRKKFFKK